MFKSLQELIKLVHCKCLKQANQKNKFLNSLNSYNNSKCKLNNNKILLNIKKVLLMKYLNKKFL